MSKSKTSNHDKAPKCAAFVKALRAVFGDVKVLYVEEGEVKLGEPICNAIAQRMRAKR